MLLIMKSPSVLISYFAAGYSSPLHGYYCRGFCRTVHFSRGKPRSLRNLAESLICHVNRDKFLLFSGSKGLQFYYNLKP